MTRATRVTGFGSESQWVMEVPYLAGEACCDPLGRSRKARDPVQVYET